MSEDVEGVNIYTISYKSGDRVIVRIAVDKGNDLDFSNIVSTPPDGSCFLHSIFCNASVKYDVKKIRLYLIDMVRNHLSLDEQKMNNIIRQNTGNEWAETDTISLICALLNINIFVKNDWLNVIYSVEDPKFTIKVSLSGNHYSGVRDGAISHFLDCFIKKFEKDNNPPPMIHNIDILDHSDLEFSVVQSHCFPLVLTREDYDPEDTNYHANIQVSDGSLYGSFLTLFGVQDNKTVHNFISEQIDNFISRDNFELNAHPENSSFGMMLSLSFLFDCNIFLKVHNFVYVIRQESNVNAAYFKMERGDFYPLASSRFSPSTPIFTYLENNLSVSNWRSFSMYFYKMLTKTLDGSYQVRDGSTVFTTVISCISEMTLGQSFPTTSALCTMIDASKKTRWEEYCLREKLYLLAESEKITNHIPIEIWCEFSNFIKKNFCLHYYRRGHLQSIINVVLIKSDGNSNSPIHISVQHSASGAQYKHCITEIVTKPIVKEIIRLKFEKGESSDRKGTHRSIKLHYEFCKHIRLLTRETFILDSLPLDWASAQSISNYFHFNFYFFNIDRESAHSSVISSSTNPIVTENTLKVYQDTVESDGIPKDSDSLVCKYYLNFIDYVKGHLLSRYLNKMDQRIMLLNIIKDYEQDVKPNLAHLCYKITTSLQLTFVFYTKVGLKYFYRFCMNANSSMSTYNTIEFCLIGAGFEVFDHDRKPIVLRVKQPEPIGVSNVPFSDLPPDDHPIIDTLDYSDCIGYSFPKLKTHQVLSDIKPDGFEYTYDKKTSQYTIVTNGIKIIKKASDMKTFPHDYAFEALIGGKEEKTFSQVGLSIPEDEENNLKPDYITQVGDTIHVVEFTTRMSESEYKLEQATVDKELKYYNALKRRSNYWRVNIKYYVISINARMIRTNLQLNEDQIRDIIKRYLFAKNVVNYAISNNDYCMAITNEKEIMTTTKQIFVNIRKEDMPANDKLCPETLNNIVRPCTQQDADYVKKLLFQNITDNHVPMDYILCESTYYTRISELMDFHKEKLKTLQQGPDCENGLRTDLKAVVQLPMALPDNSPYNFLEELDGVVNFDESPIKSLWLSVIKSSVRESLNQDLISDIELLSRNETEQAAIIEEQKKHRIKYKRYTANISSIDREGLAKLGLNGKAYRNKYEVIQYRSEKKKSFDIFKTECNDIEDFVNDVSQFDNSQFFNMNLNDKRLDSVHELIYDSTKLFKKVSGDFTMNIFKQFTNSFFGAYTRFISDIATELDISLRQCCSTNQFIVKRLKYFNCYLLCHPVGMKNIIFYSLAWKDTVDIPVLSTGCIFKQVQKIGNIFITDLCSVNISKLVNLSRCESMAMNLFAFWLDFYQIEIHEKPDLQSIIRKEPRILKMWWFTMLVSLNDKHTLEELITMTRFIHMEAATQFPQIINCGKMIEKISPIVRSRLEVYVIRCIIKLMDSYTNDCVLGRSKRNQREWSCFMNPFIWKDSKDPVKCLDRLKNQDQMLSLCYLGYLKNKDENPEANSSGKLCSKILGLEDMIPRDKNGDVDRRYLGRENPPIDRVPEYHTFSPSLIKVICEEQINKIKKETSSDPKTLYEQKLLNRLCFSYLDEFSTLKASSNFGPEWYAYDQDKKYHRPKVVEKILAILNSKDPTSTDVKVIDLMQGALESLESQGGALNICIFKKNQHGGLREIYVLDILGRIVQKVLEDMARVVLSDLTSEIMTHPKNKFLIPEKHNSECSSKLRKFQTFATSDDASKWNQGHDVVKFMIILCHFYPEYMHGFIIRSLLLWKNKRIKIPCDLLAIFNKMDRINTSDKVVQRMFDIYNGLEPETHWLRQGQTYLQTETGMLQGILHYNSSLLHILYLEWFKNVSKERLEGVIQYMEKNDKIEVIIDVMASSDDSSMLISYPSKNDNKFTDILSKIVILELFKCKASIARFLGIYNSIKSTSFTSFIMEFNSEWFFFGDVHRPTFRWVNASLQISEQENLTARQEELYNLLTGIISGGGTFFLSRLCQLGQALLHYRLLGSSVSDVWPLYVDKIKKSKDPALGYFLIDHPLATGLGGFDFLVWNACRESTLGVKYKAMYESELKKERTDNLKDITPETSTVGLFSRTTCLDYSTSKKWASIMKMFDEEKLEIETLEDDPSLLYRKPANVLELMMKIYIKMRSPGVIRSLGKGNVVSRVIASSVFVLSRPVLYSKSAFLGDPKKVSVFTLLSKSDALTNQYIRNHLREPTLGLNKRGVIDEIINHDNDFIVCLLEKLERIKGQNYYDRRTLIKNLMVVGPMDELEAISTLYEIGLGDITIHNRASIMRGSIDIQFIINNEINVHNFDSILYFDKNDENRIIFIQNTNPNKIHYNSIFTEHELQFIFPHNNSYLTFLRNIDLTNVTNPVTRKEGRRRQSADVAITSTFSRDQISLEKVLKYMWFGMNPDHHSHQTMNIMYNRYKSIIPWLEMTPNDTRMGGPFKDHISLQNFISRQDRTDRMVHVIGTLGRTRYSVMNVMTMIKDNYMNGLEYPDIHNEDSKISACITNSYLHIINSLYLLPLNPDYMARLCIDLFREGPDIKMTTFPTSTVNKLALFQKFCKHCPSLSYPTLGEDVDVISALVRTRYNRDKMMAVGQLPEIRAIFGDEQPDNDSLGEEIKKLKLSEPVSEIMYRLYEDENDDQDLMDDLAPMYRKILEQEGQTFTYDETLMTKMILEGTVNNDMDKERVITNFENIQVDIMSNIKMLRLGIFGFYKKDQLYRDGKYVEDGSWVGLFDDVQVEISFCYDNDLGFNVLTGLIITSEVNLSQTLGHLKNWCYDNNVRNVETVHSFLKRGDSKQVCLGCLNDFEKMPVSKARLPLLLLQTQSDLVQEWRFASYNLTLDHNSLKLKGYLLQDRDRNRYVTILRIPLSANSIIQCSRPIDKLQFSVIDSWPDLIHQWVTYDEATGGISDIIKSINRNDIPIIYIGDKLHEWIVTIWRARFKDTQLRSIEEIDKRLTEVSSRVLTDDELLREMQELEEILITKLPEFIACLDMDINPEIHVSQYINHEEQIINFSSIFKTHPLLDYYRRLLGEANILRLEASICKGDSVIIDGELRDNEEAIRFLYKEPINIMYTSNVIPNVLNIV